MKRCLLLFAVVCTLLCTSAFADVTVTAEDWPWAQKSTHTFTVTIDAPEGGGSVTAEVLPVTADGRELGQPIFTILNGKKLKRKEQGASVTAQAGENTVIGLTGSWTPAVSLASTDSVTVTVRVTSADDTVQTAVLEVARANGTPKASGIVLADSITVQTALIALGCIDVLILSAAFLRRKRLAR